MQTRIKGSEVVGRVGKSGRCPSCNAKLIIEDENYVLIKDRGSVIFPNGEEYRKCKCKKFFMLPKIAA